MFLTDDEFEELQNMEFSQNDWLWFYTQAVENKLLEKLKAQEPDKWTPAGFCDDGEPLYRHPLPPDDVVQKYDELLYAVHKKFPDETRHQTALRYIKTAESSGYTNAAMKEMK